MNVTYDDFLSDPDSHRQHLESCSECRRAADSLGKIEAGLAAVQIDAREPLASSDLVRALPAAPWEGATERQWSAVALVLGGVIAVAAVLFLVVGVSPLRGLLAAWGSAIPDGAAVAAVLSVGEIVSAAPLSFHLAVGIAFIVVNALFVVLLRRPPKGYDIPSR